MSSNPETQTPEPKSKGCCNWKRCWMIPFVVLGVILIKSALVLLVWNALIPDLFHGPTVTFCQAIGIVILSKLLVCGFGCRGGRFGGGPPWRRFEGLSPEQREKLRNEIRSCCE
jgi:hypothetical protein